MVLEKLGPFKIGRVLGRGGMGAVYEGTHEEDGSIVAIKVLPDSLSENEEDRVRFETEIETLKRLHHPNIVRLTGFGAEQGQLYYVMEYIDGLSLQQELRKKRLFRWHEVAKIGLEICQALRHAQNRGVIHRDIKPANILLDQEGNIKLSDFGIARFFGSQQITDIHSVIGTLEYMSPEQALAHPISSSTDLYSLGCVLYALLTGKPPFPARSLPELLRKHQTTAPASIHSLRHDAPDELGYIIADLLQMHPEDRPRNAFLVTRRLQSLLQALAGDPTEIKVLPMSLDTSKQYTESPHIQRTEKSDSGSVVDHDKIVKSKTHDGGTSPPKSELLAGSFKRIGEKHSVTIFPANSDSNESDNSKKVTPRTETVTSFSKGSLPASSDHSLSSSEDGDHFAVQNGEVVSPTEKILNKPFTAVANKDFDLFEEENRVARPMISLPVVLSSIMLLLIGLTVYYLLQPVPPDVLFARITATIREGEPAGGYSFAQLRSAQNDIRQFLAMYPDHPSAERVRAFQDELDLSEHERRLERRMQFSALRSLSPVERTYVGILTSSPTDPEQMIDQLRAFIAVFQTVRSEEGLAEGSAELHRHTSSPVDICVELARRRLIKLERDVAEINSEQTQVIRRRLDEAAEWDSTDPARAEGIRRGVITLHQNNRWARELVEEAKELLTK
jgi:serine/threonine-protein kinase